MSRVRCTYWCLHWSAIGGIRFNLVATSVIPGEKRSSVGGTAEPRVGPGVELTVRFLNLGRGPLRSGPVERLRDLGQYQFGTVHREVIQTQPFSITWLKALTVSSIETNQGLFPCVLESGPHEYSPVGSGRWAKMTST